MISMRTYIEEERLADKYERLEEHLNDFVELTQNEMTNLKQEISNMEEKIDYQLEERTRDLQEALENANTRVSSSVTGCSIMFCDNFLILKSGKSDIMRQGRY